MKISITIFCCLFLCTVSAQIPASDIVTRTTQLPPTDTASPLQDMRLNIPAHESKLCPLMPNDFLHTCRTYTHTKPRTELTKDDFNQGNITDIWQLIQAKAPGLMISRVGSDPNGVPDVRIRGLSTLGGRTTPLVVVNGVEGYPLSLIDPNDVQTVEVLRDAASLAQYGLRGASGVILIGTKYLTDKMRVSYNGLLNSESQVRRQPFMNATDFLDAGGNNKGTITDWNDEITRTAMSQTHQLHFSSGVKKFGLVNASVNFRDNQGVLRHSGNKQFGGRFLFTTAPSKERFFFTLRGAANKVTRNFGFMEAFKYANIFNPTAPVLDAANIENGGYYERGGFDIFNPVAMIDQNSNTSDEFDWQGQARLQVQIKGSLKMVASYSLLSHKADYTEKYSNQSRFRGGGSNSNWSQTNTASYTAQQFDWGVKANGFSRDQRFRIFLYSGLQVLSSNNSSDGNLYRASNLYLQPYDLSSFDRVSESGISDLMYSGMFHSHMELDSIYSIRLTYRHDRSARLGSNIKGETYPAVSIGYNLGKQIKWGNTLQINAGYGITGLQPGNPNMKNSITDIDNLGVPFLYRAQNPNLRAERTKGINVGLELGLFKNRLSATLNAYSNNTDRGIIGVSVPSTSGTLSMLSNETEMKNQGIEAGIHFYTSENAPYIWATNFTIAASKTTFVTLPYEGRTGSLGAPGMSNTTTHAIGVGIPLGQIETAVTTGQVASNGLWEIKDLDNDGVGDYFNDIAVVGNGLPDFYFGFSNSFVIKYLDINITFRGAVGHDIINSNRAFYEYSNSGWSNDQNGLRTKDYNEDVDVPSLIDLYVENASYLRIDNLAIGYSFRIKKLEKLRIYVAANNLFTLTNYLGSDPEVRLDTYNEPNNGGFIGYDRSALTSGTDRRATYVPTRVLAVGVQATF